jgi:hypothetical protein
MLRDHSTLPSMRRRAIGAICIFAIATVGACSSSSSNSKSVGDASMSGSSSSSGAGASSGSMSSSFSCTESHAQDDCLAYTAGGCGLTTASAPDAGVSSCSPAGMATPGPADDHCATADGGDMTQTVAAPSCCFGDDGGVGDGGDDESCPYGATMYGMEADDDDCKYHVVWTTTPICEGNPGSLVTVTAVYKTRFTDAGAPLPLTGANPEIETFTTTPGDSDAGTYCDDNSNHPGPTSGNHLFEGPPGTYSGNVVFDKAGAWTMRFHFNEECADIADDSPHGHAAFHVTVP